MNQPHQYPRCGDVHDRKETKVEGTLGSDFTYISKEDLHLLRRDSHNLSSLVRDLHGDLDRLDEHLNARQYYKIVNIAKSLKL
jgi:hypothetical protein